MTAPIIVLVSGGRHYDSRSKVFRVLDMILGGNPNMILMHGACGWDADDYATQTVARLSGADGLADEWARERGVPYDRHPAHWTTEGVSAGPKRNLRMAKEMLPHLVVLFPGGRGTANMKLVAGNHRIPVLQVTA